MVLDLLVLLDAAEFLLGPSREVGEVTQLLSLNPAREIEAPC